MLRTRCAELQPGLQGYVKCDLWMVCDQGREALAPGPHCMEGLPDVPSTGRTSGGGHVYPGVGPFLVVDSEWHQKPTVSVSWRETVAWQVTGTCSESWVKRWCC